MLLRALPDWSDRGVLVRTTRFFSDTYRSAVSLWTTIFGLKSLLLVRGWSLLLVPPKIGKFAVAVIPNCRSHLHTMHEHVIFDIFLRLSSRDFFVRWKWHVHFWISINWMHEKCPHCPGRILQHQMRWYFQVHCAKMECTWRSDHVR